jgi:hypothetical protein
MKKYALVQDIIYRLTEDKTFRTFFTLYLMAESDTERQTLNARFWKDAANLPEQEQQILRAELTCCFRQLPKLAATLLGRVQAITAAVS